MGRWSPTPSGAWRWCGRTTKTSWGRWSPFWRNFCSGIVKFYSYHHRLEGWDDLGGSQKYWRKNKMSAQRKDFAQHKGNVPPAACGHAEWRKMAHVGDFLDGECVGGEEGARCCGNVLVREWSALMGSETFLCLFRPQKWDKWKLWSRESRSKEFKSKWLKVGYLT